MLGRRSGAKGERPYVLRATSTVVAFWVGMVLLLIAIGTPIAIGDMRLLGFVVPPVLLIAWGLWILLYRPAVHYDADRAVITNVGRIHVLPWSHVVSLRQRATLVFELDGGKSVSAWGAPLTRGPGNVASAFDRRTRPPVDEFHRNADILDSYRRAATPSDDPITRRWDAVPLLIGALLMVAVAAEFGLGL